MKTTPYVPSPTFSSRSYGKGPSGPDKRSPSPLQVRRSLGAGGEAMTSFGGNRFDPVAK